VRVDHVVRGARRKFLGIAASKLLMFGFTVYVARTLGVSFFGEFNFALAYAGLWAIAMDLGLSVVVMREFAAGMERGTRALSASLTLRWATVPVGLVGLVAVLPFLNVSRATASLAVLFGAGMVLEAYARLAAGAFRGREDLAGDALVLVVPKAVFVGLAVAFLALGAPTLAVGWSFLAGYVAVVLWAGIALGRRHGVRLRPSADVGAMREALRVALPLALVELFTVVYFRIDTVMLQAIKGEAVVGTYNAAYRLVEAAMTIPAAFLAATFAGFARGWERDREGLRADARRSLEWMAAIAAPGVAIGMALAPDVVALVFGDAFAGSARALRVLLPALLFIYPNYVLTQLMIAGGGQNAYARYAGACAAVNVALNALLIPRLAEVGAAAATTATEAVLLAFCARHVRRTVGAIPLKNIFRVVYWSALAGVATWVARSLYAPAGWLVGVTGFVAVLHRGIDLRTFLSRSVR
jgi:O-antigen/teichoic acid export membrane protein